MILAEAIRRIHNGESMAYLFRNIAVDDWGDTYTIYIYIPVYTKENTLPSIHAEGKESSLPHFQFALLINTLMVITVFTVCYIWGNSNLLFSSVA